MRKKRTKKTMITHPNSIPNGRHIYRSRNKYLRGLLKVSACLILGLTAVRAQTPLRELGSNATPPKLRDDLVSTSLIQDQAFGWTETPRESLGALYDLKKLKRTAFSIQSSLSVGYSYDNNVNLRQTGSIASSIYSVTPNIAVAYKGSHGFTLGLRYGVNYQKFDNNALKSAFNQTTGMNFNWGDGRLRIFGNASYAKTASANIDSGDRIAADSILASLGVTYDITDKTRFGVTYSTNMFLPTNKKQYINSTGVAVNTSLIKTRMQQIGAYVDYQFSPKTSLGMGVDAGVMDVDRGNDRTFYRFLLRANWAATPKFTISGSVGPQYNKIQGESGQISPYWNLGINYRLVDTGKTTFGLNIYSNQFSSIALINQSYTAKGISGSITWVPVSRLRISTALGFEHADYFSNSSTVSSTRQDNLYFIRPGMVYAISHSASVSLFYQYTRNQSSGSSSAPFTRDTFGVAMNITF